MAEQREEVEPSRLGRIAVAKGFLGREELKRTLVRQRKLRERHAIEVRVGELLVARGELSIDQLIELLAMQEIEADPDELRKQVKALQQRMVAIKQARELAEDSGEQPPPDFSFLDWLEHSPDEALRVIRRRSERSTHAED